MPLVARRTIECVWMHGRGNVGSSHFVQEYRGFTTPCNSNSEKRKTLLYYNWISGCLECLQCSYIQVWVVKGSWATYSIRYSTTFCPGCCKKWVNLCMLLKVKRCGVMLSFVARVPCSVCSCGGSGRNTTGQPLASQGASTSNYLPQRCYETVHVYLRHQEYVDIRFLYWSLKLCFLPLPDVGGL